MVREATALMDSANYIFDTHHGCACVRNAGVLKEHHDNKMNNQIRLPSWVLKLQHCHLAARMSVGQLATQLACASSFHAERLDQPTWLGLGLPAPWIDELVRQLRVLSALYGELHAVVRRQQNPAQQQHLLGAQGMHQIQASSCMTSARGLSTVFPIHAPGIEYEKRTARDIPGTCLCHRDRHGVPIVEHASYACALTRPGPRQSKRNRYCNKNWTGQLQVPSLKQKWGQPTCATKHHQGCTGRA